MGLKDPWTLGERVLWAGKGRSDGEDKYSELSWHPCSAPPETPGHCGPMSRSEGGAWGRPGKRVCEGTHWGSKMAL